MKLRLEEYLMTSEDVTPDGHLLDFWKSLQGDILVDDGGIDQTCVAFLEIDKKQIL